MNDQAPDHSMPILIQRCTTSEEVNAALGVQDLEEVDAPKNVRLPKWQRVPLVSAAHNSL